MPPGMLPNLFKAHAGSVLCVRLIYFNPIFFEPAQSGFEKKEKYDNKGKTYIGEQ